MNGDNLVALLRSGAQAQAAGLRQFYREYAQPMMRFFVYQGLSASEAEDVLQETAIKIVRGAATYEARGEVRAWLWQVARNCLNDFLRQAARRAAHEAPMDGRELETAAQDDPRPQAIDECVTKGLEEFGRREPERAAALMLHLDELSLKEIGERLGRTSHATAQYLYECRRKLAPYIAHCTELLLGRGNQ